MSSEEFLELCEEKIAAYLNVPEGTKYEIYLIWKDYWTVGSNMDAVHSTENQRAIFGTTYNSKLFDCTFNGNEAVAGTSIGKLYMNVLAVDDTETYVIPEANE